jgi:hypothetical protein
MKRRRTLAWLLSATGLLAAPQLLRAQGPAVLVEVWKSPSCGCCKDWITHLEANGFRVKVNDVGNTAARARLKVPIKLGSCHTARVGPYAIEGHVPAADIRRLIKERPAAVGLAVPGMPVGSPGMDGPAYENRQDPYDVLLIANDGSTRVFSSYFKTKEGS